MKTIILRRFRTLVDAPIHIKDNGFATTDESQYKVLREVLANMVMHCDHFDSLRSCIRVYTDHIEFMNGGAFPLPVNEIIGKIYSKLRNPTIAKLFRYVGIAENAGYGMKKLASWEKLAGTRPTIESDRTIATVTFPLKSAIQRINAPDDTETKNNVPVNGAKSGAENGAENVPVNILVKLTDTQRKVLELINNNPSITHREMSQQLSVNEKTAQRATQALRESGLIRREGSDKTGLWVLLYKSEE